MITEYRYRRQALDVACNFMRHLQIISTFCFLFLCEVTGQTSESLNCPPVKVTVKLFKDTFAFGSDIQLTMTLTNKTNAMQSVWFDKPKSSTGGPAWTSVSLIEKMFGESVLKYSNKAVLQSQIYSQEQVKKFSYQLKPGQGVSGQFSLYDLVVVKGETNHLKKGTYEMQVFYCSNGSDKIIFTVN